MVLDGKIVVAMNSHKELCAVHCGGSSTVQKEKVSPHIFRVLMLCPVCCFSYFGVQRGRHSERRN